MREVFGDEPLLLVNGDVLFDLDLRRLLAVHRASGARATLALRRNPVPYAYSPWSATGRGRILSIAGRPAPARGPVSMFASVHVLDPALLERLPEGASDSVLDLYIPLLAEGAHLQGVTSRGAWYDFGRPRLYRDAQLRLLPGRGRDRVLVDARARVGSTARLRRSVVGAGARIAGGARVERSVLWDGAVVEAGARVSGSIVVTGGVVRSGEKAEGVIVMPAEALEAAGEGRAASSGGETWRGWSFSEDGRGAPGRRGGARPHPRVRRREARPRLGGSLGRAALRATRPRGATTASRTGPAASSSRSIPSPSSPTS